MQRSSKSGFGALLAHTTHELKKKKKIKKLMAEESKFIIYFDTITQDELFSCNSAELATSFRKTALA